VSSRKRYMSDGMSFSENRAETWLRKHKREVAKQKGAGRFAEELGENCTFTTRTVVNNIAVSKLLK